MSASISFFPSSESQRRWREHMKLNYLGDLDIPPSVFRLPDELKETKPEAYIPQIIGLGPYNHFRPGVQRMTSKKRDAVRDYLSAHQSAAQRFCDLADKGHPEFEPIIRSCYDQYLDLEMETLTWIMIVDGIVLLHFIHTYIKPENQRPTIYTDFEKLIPDAWMLENQIPIILLIHIKKILGLTSHLNVDAVMLDEFFTFCQQVSPLDLQNSSTRINKAFDKNNHLLHFLYHMIMQDNSGSLTPVPSIKEENRASWGEAIAGFASVAADHAGELYHQVVDEFNSAIEKAQYAGLNVPGNIQKVSKFLKVVERTFQIQNNNASKLVLGGDKIEIPSVSRLATIVSVKFNPLPPGSGIGDIHLDLQSQQQGQGEQQQRQGGREQIQRKGGGEKYMFYLPVLNVGPNTEVIFRNLVAYEAAITKDQQGGTTRLRDFVDLMCGLIKTEKDVQVLKASGIIKLKEGFHDEQVVNICNGIRKSAEKPDDESKVHKVIQTVNQHFNSTIFVKFWRAFMKFVGFVVRVFRAMFPFLIFALLAFQSACEVFDCRRVFHPSYGVSATRDLFLGADSGLELNPQDKFMLPRKLLPN